MADVEALESHRIPETANVFEQRVQERRAIEPPPAASLAPELRNPLDQLRGAIRTFVLLDAAITLALVFVVWVAAGIVVDYVLFKLTLFDWVLDAPPVARVALHVVLACALIGQFIIGRNMVVRYLGQLRPRWLSRVLVHEPWLIHAIIATVFAPVFVLILLTRFVFWYRSADQDTQLALVLEKRFPQQLGGKLITAIELADVAAASRAGYSAEMLQETIADARWRVADLPVSAVMNWDRLSRKGAVLGMLTAGFLVLAYLGHRLGESSHPFTRDVRLVVGQWAERNLALRHHPWPRAVHVELLQFPSSELRVGRDAPAVKVQAQAYQWVIADSSHEYGWRPLLWADLGDRLPGTATLAAALMQSANRPPDLATWPIDRVAETLGNSPAVPELLAKLDSLAIDSRYSRLIRKLHAPTSMALTYAGEKTRGRLNLTREASNTFTADLPSLKESIRFTVRAEDFTTPTRTITVVPPPQFAKLSRTEFQPAYLYHLPPVRTNSDGRIAPRDFADLKALRQVIPSKDLSLTGDKSIFSILQGTEFILHGESTKPLVEVKLIPKLGTLPGQTTMSSDPVRIAPDAGNRTRFEVAFLGSDRPTSNREFDLVLMDEDGVSSSRTIIVQVTEDAPPQVEVAVDVLRKLNNSYLVTPVARVPFLQESQIKDDHGLSRVAFVYTATKIDAQVTVEAKLPLLASVWAGAPLVPAWPTVIRSAVGIQILNDASGDTASQATTGERILSRFAEELAKRRSDTLSQLQTKLQQPSAASEPQVVKDLKLLNPDEDVFDLRAALPNLLETDPGRSQSRYRIDLSLVATDTNYETGPKSSQNLEPIRLLVISEAELLVEMSKDEEAQIGKLDEVLKKLRDAQGKLSQTVIRLRELAPPPDVLASAAVRAVDIAQDLAKAREMTAAILTEYRRLEKEARYNDLVRQQQQYDRLCNRLLAIGEGAFPRAEETHQQFAQALQESRRPDELIIDRDQVEVANLINVVAAFRAELGESLSLAGEVAKLERLQKRIRENDRIFESIYKSSLARLSTPVIAPLPLIELKVNETKKLVHPLDWLAFDGNDYRVRFEGPTGGELRFPMELRVPDDKNEVEYELTAGSKPGDYVVKLIPSVGEPVEVKIKVK